MYKSRRLDQDEKSQYFRILSSLAIAGTLKRKTRTDISIPTKATSTFLFVEEDEEGKRNEGREREERRSLFLDRVKLNRQISHGYCFIPSSCHRQCCCPCQTFFSSAFTDLIIPVPIDLLDIQPEADFVTCNKLASPNLRLVLPFACPPLLRHHALEAASIVVEHMPDLDDLRLRTRDLDNQEGLKTQGEGSTCFVLRHLRLLRQMRPFLTQPLGPGKSSFPYDPRIRILNRLWDSNQRI